MAISPTRKKVLKANNPASLAGNRGASRAAKPNNSNPSPHKSAKVKTLSQAQSTQSAQFRKIIEIFQNHPSQHIPELEGLCKALPNPSEVVRDADIVKKGFDKGMTISGIITAISIGSKTNAQFYIDPSDGIKLLEIFRKERKLDLANLKIHDSMHGGGEMNLLFLVAHPDIAEYLLNEGCSKTFTDGNGQTAYDWAKQADIDFGLYDYLESDEKNSLLDLLKP